jgi:hypothetical protein
VSVTAQIVAIIAALASLFLVVRGYSSHGVGLDRTVKMAGAWVVIILVVVALVRIVSG